MASTATSFKQLTIPLGADAFWADMADREEVRSVGVSGGKVEPDMDSGLVSLDAWRQAQPPEANVLPDEALVEGQRYQIDGGIFRAKQEDGNWQLWTWQGQNGNDVGTRTGFEVTASGGLHDRFYDVMAEEMLVMNAACFTVTDLQPVMPNLEASVLEESERVTALGRQ